MKYRPLDLSFIRAQNSPEPDNSIRNTAAMIMANAGWSKPSQVTLKEIATANAKANAKHKQGALGGLFDLLSTPLFGIANALDESIAGHQSDPNDSVLEDIAKTVGGVFTGGAKGIGAGLRGSTSLLDVLPGIDINDDWQSSPQDKTRFGDVNIRLATGMSKDDAIKPENWSDALKKARSEKAEVPDWIGNTLYGDLEQDTDQENLKTLFKHLGILGIAEDIGGDPLNFLLPGIGSGKKAADAAKLTEGLNSARAMEGISNPIIEALKIKNSSGFASKADLNAPSPVAAIEGSVISGTPKAATPLVIPDTLGLPEAFVKNVNRSLAKGKGSPQNIIDDLPYYISKGILTEDQAKILEGALSGGIAKASTGAGISIKDVAPIGDKGNFKTLSNLGRRVVPKQGVEVSPKNQSVLVKEIAQMAGSTEKGWRYKAADLLRAHPSVKWTRTEEFLQTADAAVRGKGLKHDPARMAPVLAQHIKADVEAARTAAPIERRLMNTTKDVVIRPGAPKLKRSEAILANKVVRKFEAEILHTKKAPGTGEALARAIAEGRNVRYSGPQQARMLNQITTNLKYANEAKYDKAVRILRAVEDYFISKGVIPHSSAKTAESVPIRLSQVLEALGPKSFKELRPYITGPTLQALVKAESERFLPSSLNCVELLPC